MAESSRPHLQVRLRLSAQKAGSARWTCQNTVSSPRKPASTSQEVEAVWPVETHSHTQPCPVNPNDPEHTTSGLWITHTITLPNVRAHWENTRCTTKEALHHLQCKVLGACVWCPAHYDGASHVQLKRLPKHYEKSAHLNAAKTSAAQHYEKSAHHKRQKCPQPSTTNRVRTTMRRKHPQPSSVNSAHHNAAKMSAAQHYEKSAHLNAARKSTAHAQRERTRIAAKNVRNPALREECSAIQPQMRPALR